MPDKRHSLLSASSSARWIACPGSIRMCAGCADTASEYAAEGSAAHSLAQACLMEDRSADSFIGTVTPEMARDTQIYVDVCARLMRTCAVYRVEQEFDLAALSPPVAMYGFADFIGYDDRRQELHIVDFKFGRGVWVPARDNTQLKYYALGAMLAIDQPVSTIITTVVQPRTAGDPIRSAVISAAELSAWGVALMEHARATQRLDAPLRAGEHCRFCPAKAGCPTLQSARAAEAFKEFGIVETTSAGA